MRVLDMLLIMIRKHREFRVVLIHVYSGRAFLWTLSSVYLAKILRKKIILWLHGGNLPNYYKVHPMLVDRTFAKTDKIFAPSKYLAQAFEDKFDVEILPYELPINSYPVKVRRNTAPRLFWLRAFNAGYNPVMAVRVVHQLQKKYANTELIMAGPDNGDGSLQKTRQLAKELGVSDRIKFTGLVTKKQIKEIGSDCDIFINTTNVDNTPVSVVEAMAMGLCVISTNVGGIPFLINNEEDGLLVEANDYVGMSLACERILMNPDLSEKLSRNARKKSQMYDWSNLSKRWCDIIFDLHGNLVIDDQ